jgi:uracil-DNA glycosylase
VAAHFGNEWDGLLKEEFEKEYYRSLRKALIEEYRNYTVFPESGDIFNALKCAPPRSIRVAILGQDPYHGEGQAHGLSFSVKKGVAVPPSLKNIFSELKSDLGIAAPSHGDLTAWAGHGVLLLNSILTVRAHQPASHRKLGWEAFTDRVIELVSERGEPTVFVLWGAFAQSKGRLVANSRHLVISSPHPSPLSASRGFFGSRPFSKANDFLVSQGLNPVDWSLS